MNPDMQTALTLAWAKFQVDTKLTPEALDDADRMIFQIGFALGMKHGLEVVKKELQL